MELVKLKMKSSYKMFLFLIGLLILVLLGIGILYFTGIKLNLFSSEVEVNGSLSINYPDGKTFNLKEDGKIDFSVTNNGSEVYYYIVAFSKVRGEGRYTMYCNDSEVDSGELKTTNEILSEALSIDANTTKNCYVLINKTTDTLKTTIKVRVQEKKILTFADVLLNDNKYSIDTLTKPGSEVALENEGLIKSSDDLGVTYYFRGNINNNYVSFANNLWRIVRINGDGTVRLVLDGETNTISSYYTSDNKNYEYMNSHIKEFLDSWYSFNLSQFGDYIANSYFCNDISHDEDYIYSPYTRVMVNKIPSFNCLGNSFRNNIGLLTIDEVMFAGANTIGSNQNFYLYNSKISSEAYTMSASKGSEEYMNLFMLNVNGSLDPNKEGNLNRSIRPVINLKKDVVVNGNGTIDNPYIVI